MKVPENRPIAQAGVIAARAFFEAERCVFQEVGLENDFGKDAYVDQTDAERHLTGLCVALQIKSGAKYRRSDG